jgi:ligand-binding SRPBCC domain-containing protein
MAFFKIETFINNKPEVVFNLSRSIDLHLISTSKTNEKAIAGVTTGLINLNESVTWEANHLFKKRYFTSKITAYNFPFSFTDEMQKGDLKSFSHQHIFESKEDGTLMTDIVHLEAPYVLLGKFVLWLFLKNYFKALLTERNEVIKEYAENEKWKLVLNEK